MNAVGRGLKRRGRLMAQALGPPRVKRPPRPAAAPSAGARPVEVYTAPHAGRLVESPVFVLSSVRSGSTLLRVLLNSHPQIRAPHEMHLRTVHVRLTRPYTAGAMQGLQLDRPELEHLLWDRVLHVELERSGKQIIVDKTPANALIWERLVACWPQARRIVLLRHPGAVVTSLINRRTNPDIEAIHTEVLRYAEALEGLRRQPGGHVVTYERLTAEPEQATRDICAYLGVAWDPGMLDYGEHDHGTFRPHMGDWSSNIKSGRIQPARETEHYPDLPARLAELAEAWGYQAVQR